MWDEVFRVSRQDGSGCAGGFGFRCGLRWRRIEQQRTGDAYWVTYSDTFYQYRRCESVDAGHGWLIFALPPGEAAFHPSGENGPHELYFLCDSLKAEMASLAEQGVRCSEVQEARWGSITKMRLPGGGEVGLYQPKHPTALGLGAD